MKIEDMNDIAKGVFFYLIIVIVSNHCLYLSQLTTNLIRRSLMSSSSTNELFISQEREVYIYIYIERKQNVRIRLLSNIRDDLSKKYRWIYTYTHI